MGTKNFFDNKVVKLPGAYSTIVSGEQSQPLALDYGKVLVIDTGVEGATWGGGSGIDGEQKQGKDAIYTFDNLGDYQSFLKGGLFWKAADALFKPDKKSAAPGVSTILHARACTTTKAQMTFTAVGGGSNGGTFKVNTIDEGLNANGVLTSTHLDKGYAYTIETGVVDTAKWIFKIWLGSWVGDHTDGISYNEVLKSESTERLVVESPEFDNIQDLIDWANTDSKFGTYFSLDSSSAVAGSGLVDATDVAAITGYIVATGGTETFSSANLNLILDAVADEDFSFILTDQYGKTDYKSTEIEAIKAWNLSESLFKRFLYIGGGKDVDEFSGTDGSIEMAVYHNSAYVHVCHGDIYLASDSTASNFRLWPTLFTTALMVGRTAGKQPQIPLTNKSLGIDKLEHSLSKKEKERALDSGLKVFMLNKYISRFVCVQDVNTLQDNTRLFTPTGKGFSGSFMRIVEQINKELVVNSETDLLADENGVNVNTLGKGTVENFTSTYLESRLATESTDNLLLSYRDVVATRDSDAWNVSYGIVVNNEISKIFYTGFLFS